MFSDLERLRPMDSIARGPRSLAILNKLADVCGDSILDVTRDGITIRITLKAGCLRKALETIYSEHDLYFRTLTASDERREEGVYKLYYVLGIDSEGTNLVIEVPVPEGVEIYTASDLFRASDWYELEAHDLFGIRFNGRTLRRLVLPEDWPEDLHPLRKDVSVEELRELYQPQMISRVATELGVEEVVRIPIGPYHPALHEPEYFELYVRGEKVVDARYIGFMVHRGIEKLAESMKYDQVPFLAERICGICGFVHSTSYVQAVEDALNIEVPERAEFIRSIVLEVERLHSHLLWLGVALHLLGYDTGFMHAWRIREKIMVLAELLTGSRKTYGIALVGGVKKDIAQDTVSKVKETLDRLKREYREFVDVATSVPQVRARLTGTGILPRGEARAYSLVGPTVRGSGLARDVRKDYTYAAYHYVSFNVPVYTEGDNLARTLVRVDEVFESISILEQLIDMLPSGPIMVESWETQPMKLGIGSVEAPRGEVIHVVVTGHYSPYRWRVRAPTYQNLQAVPIMLKGVDLADAPLTIASIDPCFSCTDRATIINLRSGSVKTVPIEIISRRGSGRG
ncbi:MAG: NADH-quinone oxidoreductase subunit C [Zestosphaera sp.]